MMHQEFTLDRWGWRVSVFYEVGADDAPILTEVLRDAGCTGRNFRKAMQALREGEPNFGITYTNYRERESVMIIGKTTSADEFSNSYDHEVALLVKHICQALRINPWGEEAEYLAGAVGQKTFTVAKRLLCEHCRKRNEFA